MRVKLPGPGWILSAGITTTPTARELLALSKEEQESREIPDGYYDLLDWDKDEDAWGNAPFLP